MTRCNNNSPIPEYQFQIWRGLMHMNTRRKQLYLAHAMTDDSIRETDVGYDDDVIDMTPAEAAEYIASLLSSLRLVAAKSQFRLLADLISVAEEEARFHCQA
ncbi:hypothetical protein KKP04_14620 [Rhodomicrobium sp. Az07]|uniref:hypothetical protein n=1 Tax=Rhodomicrobium sp. Az07 TaxID=2839034 RepID=UPI001BE71919|nr:hypothetical protein [Rhodomicrobium sp. Az07]MBT3072091.1 hypothetical protein [Rhodomicrobium sp. Az07]